ncbi:hypothetical protein NKDENANG_01840 [Candidatus Entotheonellaceae bacterium PAL068K]
MALEALGTPSATVCTEGFKTAGAAQARTLGMPDYELVIIDHPLTTMPRREVERQAQRAWQQIERLLLNSP